MKNNSYYVELDLIVNLPRNEVNNIAEKLLLDANLVTGGNLFLASVREIYAIDSIEQQLMLLHYLITEARPDIKLVFIFDSWYKGKIKQPCVIFVDFFLILCYKALLLDHKSDINTHWNPSNSNFLFLTGKPAKRNRVGLLYKFKHAGLLSRCSWSLFIDNINTLDYQTILPGLSDVEIVNFLENHARRLDSIKLFNSGSNIHYGGIPYDVSIRANSKFLVISETFFEDSGNAWCTEKTWLSIINHQPFIMAGSCGTLNLLKSYGYRTFENYLLHPDYDSVTDPELRLNLIVENTKFWLNNIEQFKDQIEIDVKHNFQRFCSQFEENIQAINTAIIDNNLNCIWSEIAAFEDIYLHNTWSRWYSRVKDESWPACDSEEDFKNLPIEIQMECIEIFNYRPKEDL